MKIKTAVNRVFWRFGGNDNKNPFPVNEADVEAYNRIKEYVEEKETEQFANNELFAKMFILMYMKVLEKDGGSVYDTRARMKICDFLRLPIDGIVEKFTSFLNDSAYDDLVITLGAKIKHPALQTDAEVDEFIQKLNEALRKPENEKIFFRQAYEHDFVKDCLIAEVNQAIELCR